MAQTLNFSINIEQSQIPTALAQLQGGINNQLQAGALQLGTMASGLTATMAGLNVMGGSPSSMGFAHMMAPGAVNYSLGRAPFVDRTDSIRAFVAQSSNAVKAQANAIIATMDPSKLAPTVASDGRWKGVGAVLGAGALGLAGSLLGGAAGGYLGAKTGVALGGMIGYMAGSSIVGAGINTALDYFGVTQPKQFSEAELQKMTAERRGYAEMAATMMAIGPQKYMPAFGGSVDTEGNIKAAQSISNEFIKRQDYSVIARAAGKNPAYFAEMITALSTTDPEGYKKYAMPMHRYFGANAGAVPEEMGKKFADYAVQRSILAQAQGYKDVTDPNYQSWEVFKRSGAPMFVPKYKGPNIYQIMGKDLGKKTRLGAAFGSDFVNALRSRVTKDLGMSSEERGWLGGAKGIAHQYASVALGEMSTLGSQTSILYAAAVASGGKLGGDIYETTAQAAGIFTDPGKAVDMMLNYKRYVTAGGPTDVMYRKSIQMQAQQLMAQSGGSIKSEYDAARLILMKGYQMDAEQATAQAGVIYNVGRAVVSKGGTGGYTDLWSKMSGEVRSRVQHLMVQTGRAKSSAEAEAKLKANAYRMGNIPLGDAVAKLVGEGGAGAAKAYIESGGKVFGDWGRQVDKELAKVGMSLQALSKTSVGITQASIVSEIGNRLFEKNVSTDPMFGVRTAAHRDILVAASKSLSAKDQSELFAAQTRARKAAAKGDHDAKDAADAEIAKILSRSKNKILMSPDTIAALRDVDLSGASPEKLAKFRKEQASNIRFSDSGGESGEYDIDEVNTEMKSHLEGVIKGLDKLAQKIKRK